MEEKTEILECTENQIVISNSYSPVLTALHNLLFCLLILFGIFLIIQSPFDPDSLEAKITISGFLITKLKGNTAIIFVKLAGLFFILLSLFALSIKRPNLVTFMREQAIINLSGRSWFGILPYQETIPFNKVISQDISREHSVVILPLKSGKKVFIGTLTNLKIVDAIIVILRSVNK
ncbi:hypothetical protein [Rippkaea orientalis]|nr:hypothetical protein [Rippkaea orientalis]